MIYRIKDTDLKAQEDYFYYVVILGDPLYVFWMLRN